MLDRALTLTLEEGLVPKHIATWRRGGKIKELTFESANRGRLVSLASQIITGKYFSVIEKLLLIFWFQLLICHLMILDINECHEENEFSAKCHSTAAICTNTPGSYQCQCKPGFEGDGRTCVGKSIYIFFCQRF